MKILSARFFWSPGRLARDAAASTLWFAVRMVAQTAYLALIGRLFGASGLGIFSGVIAFGAFASPFATAGIGGVMVRKAAQAVDSLSSSWHRSLALTLCLSLPIFGASLLICRFWFPAAVTSAVILTLLLSEIIASAFLNICSAAYQAEGHPGAAVSVTAWLWLTRSAVLGLAVVLQHCPDLLSATRWHLLSSTAFAGFCLVRQQRRAGPFHFMLPGRAEIVEGLAYASSWVAGIAFTDMNQALLLGLISASEVGRFSAAYKLVMAATAPTLMLAFAAAKRLFEHSHRPDAGSRRRSNTIIVACLGLGVLSSLLVFVVAPLLPLLLGHDFEASAGIAQSIAVVAFLIGARSIAATLLTSGGRQSRRILIEWLIIPLSIAINYALVRRLGLTGAIYGTITVETMMSLFLWGAARKLPP